MGNGFSLALRFALREWRGGLRGFYVFIACIALGVFAIAGVGSISASLSDGLSRQARVLLGGDVTFALFQREATPQELAFLHKQGEVSRVATLRGMAHHLAVAVALSIRPERSRTIRSHRCASALSCVTRISVEPRST